MTVDLFSVLITIAVAIAAIVSPAVTTCMNNKHAEKMFKLEFYVKHRAEILERYLRNVGALIATEGHITAREEYLRSYGEVFLYLPEDLHQSAKTLDSLLDNHEYRNARIVFSSLCKDLALCTNIGDANSPDQKHE